MLLSTDKRSLGQEHELLTQGDDDPKVKCAGLEEGVPGQISDFRDT